MNLTTIGFNEYFEKAFEEYKAEGYTVGRISLEHKRMYRVWTEAGELLCEVAGKFSYMAASREDYPAVGDWVVLQARPSEGR